MKREVKFITSLSHIFRWRFVLRCFHLHSHQRFVTDTRYWYALCGNRLSPTSILNCKLSDWIAGCALARVTNLTSLLHEGFSCNYLYISWVNCRQVQPWAKSISNARNLFVTDFNYMWQVTFYWRRHFCSRFPPITFHNLKSHIWQLTFSHVTCYSVLVFGQTDRSSPSFRSFTVAGYMPATFGLTVQMLS